MTLMPTEQERLKARERAAEVRRKCGGKGSWERLREAFGGAGPVEAPALPPRGFRPAVAAESEERMKALAEAHGFGFSGTGSSHLAMKNRPKDFPYGFPSPGGYEMHVHGPVPRELRDVLEEAAGARVRGGDGPLLPACFTRGSLPEMEADGMAWFGFLPEDRLYLLRTPGGMLAVLVDLGRDAGLHRAMWGTGGLGPLDLTVAFGPDGTLREADILRLSFGVAYEVLRADAGDWWSVPGSDVQEILERSVRVKTMEGVAMTAAAGLYDSMVRSFAWRYGVPEQRPQPGSVEAGELTRRLMETAVAYRDVEYEERRRRAAEFAAAGTPRIRPAEPEKPRRTFAESVYQGLVD